jgi:hygromycin-B 4-O-kinase
VFDWSGNQLSRNASWQDFLDAELGLDERLELFVRHNLLTAVRQRELRAVLEGADRAQAPALNHGDLRPKNVMVDGEGRITAIIDWEDCLSSLAPQWELSVALHDLPIDERQALLDGYGIGSEDLARIAPLVKAINLLNYAPHVAHVAAEGDERGLERVRQRFSGALDLYAL